MNDGDESGGNAGPRGFREVKAARRLEKKTKIDGLVHNTHARAINTHTYSYKGGGAEEIEQESEIEKEHFFSVL